MKKPHPRKHKHEAEVLEGLGAMVTDLRKWLAEGLPAREPITQVEVERRVALYEKAEAVIRGEC